ncbi:MAG: hypothetical protein K0S08_1714 [Gammaproteobacteria bacterium]|jgi:hypothetical protein|nr:hypothetical protein [Gammaproteobacteria bacterium]
MRYVFIGTVIFLLSACVTARQQNFPDGNLIIPPSTILQIENISTQPILLDIAQHNGTAQAGYASKLDPKHQSIFSHQTGELQLACYSFPLKPNMPKLDCKKILTVKVLPKKKQKLNGNYWVEENKLG